MDVPQDGHAPGSRPHTQNVHLESVGVDQIRAERCKRSAQSLDVKRQRKRGKRKAARKRESRNLFTGRAANARVSKSRYRAWEVQRDRLNTERFGTQCQRPGAAQNQTEPPVGLRIANACHQIQKSDLSAPELSRRG